MLGLIYGKIRLGMSADGGNQGWHGHNNLGGRSLPDLLDGDEPGEVPSLVKSASGTGGVVGVCETVERLVVSSISDYGVR